MVNLYAQPTGAAAGTFTTVTQAQAAVPQITAWAQDPFGSRWWGFTAAVPALSSGVWSWAAYSTAAAFRIEQA